MIVLNISMYHTIITIGYAHPTSLNYRNTENIDREFAKIMILTNMV